MAMELTERSKWIPRHAAPLAVMLAVALGSAACGSSKKFRAGPEEANGVRLKLRWSGIEGEMPDEIPVIGPSRTTPGLFHAFGFSGHGFQLGPAMGEILGELVSTGKTDTPIAAFDIGRFASTKP